MIEMGKKYRIVRGNDVVIHTVNGLNKDFPVIGEIVNNTLHEPETTLDVWTLDGKSVFNDSYDLVEVKEKHNRRIWLNIYKDCISLYQTKESADAVACDDRIACVEITFAYEEGEGL